MIALTPPEESKKEIEKQKTNRKGTRTRKGT